MFFVQNGIFSVLFAIAFFIGGTFNVFYAIDNGDRFNDAGCSDSTESEYCNDVQMLLATEAASTVSYCDFYIRTPHDTINE